MVTFCSAWNHAVATQDDPGINHWLANQGFNYALTGNATKLSDGSISVAYFINFEDNYVFNNTGLGTGFGMTDNDWHRMAVVGLAKPYEIIGTSSKHKFIIE